MPGIATKAMSYATNLRMSSTVTPETSHVVTATAMTRAPGASPRRSIEAVSPSPIRCGPGYPAPRACGGVIAGFLATTTSWYT